MGARIIMVADTVDAMTTDSHIEKALPLQRAIEELRKYAGLQFDPKLVELVSGSPGIRRLLGAQTSPEPSLTPKHSGGYADRTGASVKSGF